MFLMRREAFPNIKFDVIIVNTVFPGASPEEVERRSAQDPESVVSHF